MVVVEEALISLITKHWQKQMFDLGVGCGTEENWTVILH